MQQNCNPLFKTTNFNNMTKDTLLEKLNGIEWDDFEVKEAQNELPKSVWETVSAFSNTSGGWIVLGIQEIRKKGKSIYQITGVNNAEKQEQDFVGTLRSQTKFNLPIAVSAQKFDIEGKCVLAFYIPSSPIKPVYLNNNLTNTFIRTGSGDQRATNMEISAIQRDQAFGSRSEQQVPGTSIEDINPISLQTYRRSVQQFNSEFVYNNLNDEDFCRKIGITINGCLTYGSLLMFGKRDSVQNIVNNFWIDYIEIPGTSYDNAVPRYTYRMPEQDNIWEYYQLLIQKLKVYADNPFSSGPNGFSPDDNSQLYSLREGLVNYLAHADYFSPMHSTIRVYSNRIEFQNPGRFFINLNRLKEQIVSMPRNPSIIKFFRYAKLSENAGYGIDKMLKWKSLTGKDIIFSSELTFSTVIYPFPDKGGQKRGGQKTEASNQITKKEHLTDDNSNIEGGQRKVVKKEKGGQKERGQKTRLLILELMKANPTISRKELSEQTQISESAIQKHIAFLKEQGTIIREGGNKFGSWKVIE